MIIYPRKKPKYAGQASYAPQAVKYSESIISASLVLTVALVALTLSGDVTVSPKSTTTEQLARN